MARPLIVVGEAPNPDAMVKAAMSQFADVTYLHVNEWTEAVDSGQRPRDSVVVTLGKKPFELVFEEKVKFDGVIGERFVRDFGILVCQYHPVFVVKASANKGGASEKVKTLWIDIWDVAHNAALGEDEVPIPDVEVCTDFDRVCGWLDWLTEQPDLAKAYDYETWGDVDALRPELNKVFRILTVGVAWNDGEGPYALAFPLHWPREKGGWTQDQIAVIEEKWWRIVIGGGSAHNAKYEHKCNLVCFGDTGPLRDTMLMDNCLNELASHTLHRTAARCGVGWTRYKSEADKMRKNPIDSELEPLLKYNALDALITLITDVCLEEQLVKEGTSHIARMEEGFCESFARLEYNGVAVDNAQAAAVRAEYRAKLPVLQASFLQLPEVKKVEKWATDTMKTHKKGAVFSAKSPPMMKRLIIDVLKVPIKPRKHYKQVMREDGSVYKETVERFKLDKRAIAPFENEYPVLKKLAEVRSVEAMLSGFLDKWHKYVCSRGLVHTQFNQAKAVTQRVTSTNPPLQNIPKDSIVRKVFVSRFGKNGRLVNADFVQQEPRILAGWSGDDKMIQAILDGLNLHGYVASEIFGVKYDGKATEKYDIGKRMNLGIMFGQTEYGLSEKTGIPLEEAQSLLRRYDDRFQKIAKWRLGKQQTAMRYGYSEDLFGGKRHLPEAKSPDKWMRAHSLRQACNYPIQRTAAIFTFKSCQAAEQMIRSEGWIEQMCLCLTVHDSLVGDACDAHYEKKLIDVMAWAMTDLHNTSDYWGDKGVPMVAEFDTGYDMFKREKLGERHSGLVA